jgi:hypothetical protein
VVTDEEMETLEGEENPPHQTCLALDSSSRAHDQWELPDSAMEEQVCSEIFYEFYRRLYPDRLGFFLETNVFGTNAKGDDGLRYSR